MKNQIIFTYRYLMIISLTPTHNIALLLFTSVIFLVTIVTYITFKLNYVLNINLMQEIIIISICHKNRMSLYGFFCLNPVTNSLRDVLNIFYSDNIKTWMKNGVC